MVREGFVKLEELKSQGSKGISKGIVCIFRLMPLVDMAQNEVINIHVLVGGSCIN